MLYWTGLIEDRLLNLGVVRDGLDLVVGPNRTILVQVPLRNLILVAPTGIACL